MPVEPSLKRAVTFVDGQNLFHAARAAFGRSYPDYDVQALSQRICAEQGWALLQARFYTGIPDASDDPYWNHFWIGKLRAMSWRKTHVFSRRLRYRNRRVTLPDGSKFSYLAGEEKGVDVRIAIDVIRMAHRREYDVALIFSQDQDLSEVASEIRAIAGEQDRWIKIASAYPVSPTVPEARGINKTDWIPITRAVYETCLDPRDYRGKPPSA
jgi:uncharacterized LabA/DUF88 family protein